jgi:hypothetical protein
MALSWGAAGAAAAAAAPATAAAAVAPDETCDEDRDRDRPGGRWDGGLGPLLPWFSNWGLGDPAVRGCDGEWNRCRDDSWPLYEEGRADAAPRRDDARPAGTASAGQAAGPGARTGTAPRVIARGGTCETPDGVIEAIGEIVTVPAGGSAVSVAECPSGTTAVSGGWSTGEPGLVAGLSQRLGTDRWRVAFDNPTDGELSGLAYAYCTGEEDDRGPGRRA